MPALLPFLGLGPIKTIFGGKPVSEAVFVFLASQRKQLISCTAESLFRMYGLMVSVQLLMCMDICESHITAMEKKEASLFKPRLYVVEMNSLQ